MKRRASPEGRQMTFGSEPAACENKIIDSDDIADKGAAIPLSCEEYTHAAERRDFLKRWKTCSNH